MPKDTQVTELAGRHWLVGQLLTFGLEVAQPVRDRGVDLVVYQERMDPFCAAPVQVKASSYRMFGFHRKYEKAPGLLHAFVWNVRPGGETAAFVLRGAEVIDVATRMGWTSTASWARGAYSTRNPSEALMTLLAPYFSTVDRWRGLLQGRSPSLFGGETGP